MDLRLLLSHLKSLLKKKKENLKDPNMPRVHTRFW